MKKATGAPAATLLMDSPLGTLALTASADGEALASLVVAPKDEKIPQSEAPPPVLLEAERQIRAYFAGGLREFDLPLAPKGTAFQHKVWAELRRIPYGDTLSYGELARRAGSPRGARAAGAACGQNPIFLVIPCHRALAANGALTGFAYGLPAKRTLLALEGRG